MNERNLDRDLRELFAAGPSRASAPTVVAALTRAASIDQRRPRLARLDRRAWPPQARSAADPALHRTVRLVAVAALLLLVATVVAVGARMLEASPTVTIVTAGTLDTIISPRLSLWPDGRILVQGQGGARSLFDPATGATESLTFRLAFAGAWAGADVLVLADGRVALLRDEGAAESTGASVEVAFYDRATGAIERAGSYASPWFGEAVLVLRDGRLLISGGVEFETPERPAGGAKDIVQVFDPATGLTTEVGRLRVARFQHQMLELEDGRILVVGGGDYGTNPVGGGEALEVEVFDLGTAESKVVGSLPPRGQPILLRAIELADGRILIPGVVSGEYPCGIPSLLPGQHARPEEIPTVYRQGTYVFDPASEDVTNGPTLPHYFGGNLVPLPDGRALAFGYYGVVHPGCDRTSGQEGNPWLGVIDLADNAVFETYDPRTGAATLDVAVPREYAAGLALPDGRIALLGDAELRPRSATIDIVTVGP